MTFSNGTLDFSDAATSDKYNPRSAVQEFKSIRP